MLRHDGPDFTACEKENRLDVFVDDITLAPVCLSHTVGKRDRITKTPIPRPTWDADKLGSLLGTQLARLLGCNGSDEGAPAASLRRTMRDPATGAPLHASKVVGFSFGSMASLMQPGIEDAAIFEQHALLIAMGRLLFPHARLYVQDPAYEKEDVDVLAEHGVQVLADPSGFTEVDDDTVVLSFSSNIGVHEIVADMARPIAMIWEACEEETP